jgi:hypothetical protein
VESAAESQNLAFLKFLYECGPSGLRTVVVRTFRSVVLLWPPIGGARVAVAVAVRLHNSGVARGFWNHPTFAGSCEVVLEGG